MIFILFITVKIYVGINFCSYCKVKYVVHVSFNFSLAIPYPGHPRAFAHKIFPASGHLTADFSLNPEAFDNTGSFCLYSYLEYRRYENMTPLLAVLANFEFFCNSLERFFIFLQFLFTSLFSLYCSISSQNQTKL